MTMQYHPLCLALPDMVAPAFAGLIEDIRSNGQRHDIILHEGMILDGRHRYRACLECGIDPRFSDYTGSDPAAFVISENLARRHLNESQRAMVAARIANRKVGGTVDSANLQNEIVTREKAAKLLVVSDRTIAKAVRVKDEGAAALVEKVDAGKISVHEAAKIVALNPKVQARLAAIDDRKLRQRELSASLNRSASRTRTARVDVLHAVPGTEFVRATLNRLDQITSQLLEAEGSAEAFASRFLTEFDWNEPILLQRFKHARRAIEAIAQLQRELERRPEAA
ncbi:ParB/RepB/Spo0J family partition protein [Lysobacter sp. CA199]|uniref:ParB/RepB/Spo0J family partition protein n=1 Tax=Lysobacter sp. CA199 TaxID=3455608 RepID=UPI003F8D3ABA